MFRIQKLAYEPSDFRCRNCHDCWHLSVSYSMKPMEILLKIIEIAKRNLERSMGSPTKESEKEVSYIDLKTCATKDVEQGESEVDQTEGSKEKLWIS